MNAPIPSIARAALAAALLAPLPLFISCMARQGISRDVRASEGTGVEMTGYGAALVRSVYCDIIVEPVSEALWGRLYSSGIYRRTPLPGALQRVPPVTAFQVIIKSTVNAPLILKHARLLYGKSALDAMTSARIRERLKSPSYSGIDIDRMLSLRRLIRDRDPADRMEYEHDTIELKLDFAPPRDTVMTVIFFEKMPAEARTFRLRLTITAMGNDKNLDIDFARHEYRAGKEDAQWRKKRGSAGDDE